MDPLVLYPGDEHHVEKDAFRWRLRHREWQEQSFMAVDLNRYLPDHFNSQYLFRSIEAVAVICSWPSRSESGRLFHLVTM